MKWPTSCSAIASTPNTPSSIACCSTTRRPSATSASPAPPKRNRPPTTRPRNCWTIRPTRISWPPPRSLVQALQARSKQIPNLISPHLGNSVLTAWSQTKSRRLRSCRPRPRSRPQSRPPPLPRQPDPNQIVALPLGGRIKLDPWDDQLAMLKSKPVGAVAEREKMPFEITPFILFLTRDSSISTLAPGAVSAQSQTEPNHLADKSAVAAASVGAHRRPDLSPPRVRPPIFCLEPALKRRLKR